MVLIEKTNAKPFIQLITGIANWCHTSGRQTSNVFNDTFVTLFKCLNTLNKTLLTCLGKGYDYGYEYPMTKCCDIVIDRKNKKF